MPVLTWETIANTPWWVFVLYAFSFKLSLNARKPSTLPVNHLLIAPIYCVFLGLITSYYLLHPSLLQLSNSLLGLALGLTFGWFQLSFHQPTLHPALQRITLKGSSLPLILFFASNFMILCYPTTLNKLYTALMNGQYNAYILFFYGLGAGSAIGRFTYAKGALKNATMP